VDANLGARRNDLKLRLDDLYRMTSFIYHDSNLGRSREATLLHFFEVCGMLTLLDRKKKRDRVDVPGALCKALGWYFPLLAKMGVESVERLLFTKYPNVCPYCRKSPHVEQQCKLIKGTEGVLSHELVRGLTEANWERRPAGLNEWQRMFDAIYPRSLNSTGFSIIALMEELGELAEAVRVFDRYPHYFYGEAADVFSYLMGLANEYTLRCSERGETFDYELEFLARYPGLCIACGARVCVCPTVPPATVGRMAKEMPISVSPISNPDAFDAAGRETAEKVLESVSQVPALAKHLPYDRGEMNAGLTQLAFRLAHALEENHKDTADRLLALAIELGREKRSGGTLAHTIAADVLDVLKEAWLKADPAVQQAIENEQPALGKLAHILETRVLIVTANPRGENDQAIRLDKEISAIRQRVRLGTERDRIHIETLTAATVDSLRVELLSNSYDVIHFAGHADADGLELLGDDGVHNLSFDALAKMVAGQKSLKCVVLNTCSAMQGLSTPFAPLVIGMVDEIDDEEALVFAKGFYDALAAGQSPAKAYDVATTALESEGLNPHIVVKLAR
jgi:hypothetical protein